MKPDLFPLSKKASQSGWTIIEKTRLAFFAEQIYYIKKRLLLL
jgi:hypothetical protein